MADIISLEVGGLQGLLKAIDDLERGAMPMAISVVSAGTTVFKRAAVDASPGTIKSEIGRYLKIVGKRVTGRAGLMRYPKRGDGQNGPHGYYVDQGTKFISARRFIGPAMRRAIPAAMVAMQRAAERRVARVVAAK